MGKKRLLSLDALKGFAILLVIFGHVYLGADSDIFATKSYLHRFILAVHMPLFVLVSGYFAQRKVDSLSSLKQFFQDKFVRLILPAMLWYPFWRLWNDGQIEWVGIFGNQYWFTLHLFIYVALFLVQRSVVDLVLHALPKKKALAWEVILHIVFTIGIYYFIHDGILRLYPAAANILPIVRTRLACLYPYLVIGWIIGRLDLLDKLRSPGVVAIAFILFVVCIGFLIQDPNGDQYLAQYLGYGLWHINRLMALSFSVLMIYALDALTEGEGRLGRWLVLLGQWSLPIYFVHYFFLPVFPGVHAFLGRITPSNQLSLDIFIGLAGTLMTLLPSLAVIYCIRLNPYLDFALFGEKGRLMKK
ncbi:MAG: acyltransferase [Porphyromonadaceae bacterium]|jgi:membrane protein|nr:acyltransferase [Porphyromonadaceae bacterium]